MADKNPEWYPHPGLDQSLVNQIAFQNLYKLRSSAPGSNPPPSNSSDPGTENEIRMDGAYLYVYSGGSWHRSALSSF